MLQLASLRPYPGQDLPLASFGLAAAKLALVTRLLDLGVAANILGLAALLSNSPHGSLLELSSEILVTVLVTIPVLCAGMLASVLLLVLLQVKTIISVISLALLLGAFISSCMDVRNTTKGFINNLQQAANSLPNQSTINVLVSRSCTTDPRR